MNGSDLHIGKKVIVNDGDTSFRAIVSGQAGGNEWWVRDAITNDLEGPYSPDYFEEPS